MTLHNLSIIKTIVIQLFDRKNNYISSLNSDTLDILLVLGHKKININLCLQSFFWIWQNNCENHETRDRNNFFFETDMTLSCSTIILWHPKNNRFLIRWRYLVHLTVNFNQGNPPNFMRFENQHLTTCLTLSSNQKQNH